jgi:hypothetical protein
LKFNSINKATEAFFESRNVHEKSKGKAEKSIMFNITERPPEKKKMV